MNEQHTVLLREFFMCNEEINVIAFKEAGDELVDFILRGQKYSWYEAFIRPIGLLYRHYLELEIKYWITELDVQTFKKPTKFLHDHNLKKLWDKLKPLILSFCTSQEEQTMLNDVEQVILLFHEYDPTGQEFRYSRTTKGKETLSEMPPKIDVKSIKCSIARVDNFFNGLSGVIHV